MFIFKLNDGLKYTAQSYSVVDDYSGAFYILDDVIVEYNDFLKCHLKEKMIYDFEIIDFIF